MRFKRLGRIVSGLATILLFGYLLTRGVYVGSITMLNTPSGLLVYEKYCHYLSLTGVHDVRVSAALTDEDAGRIFCPPLRNEKVTGRVPNDL
jgi:hypothetical protein